MAESTARIGIYADDKASPVVKSVQGSLQGLQLTAKQSILAGVGLGTGVAAWSAMQRAIGGVTDFLTDSIKAATQDEESVSRLGQSLKQNVPAWDGNTAAIEKRIAAGEKLAFTDEDLRNSLALLVGATHDVGEAQKLQNAAMDLARLKGIDLQTASDALIKVEGGRYRILASLGIQLEKNATKTQVLAAIEKIAGGQAAEFATTTAGAMAGAQIQFEELKEEIGRAFLPILKDLAQFARDDLLPALQSITKTIKDAKPVWDALGSVVGFVSKGVQLAVAPVLLAADAMGTLSDAMDQGFSDMPIIVERGVEASRRAAIKVESGIVEDASRLPKQMADELLKNQFSLTDATTQLVEFMKQALSPAAQMAQAQAFLASQAYKDGMASGRPSVVAKTIELRDAALAVLKDTTGAAAGGTAVAQVWVNYLVAKLNYDRYKVAQALYGYKLMLIGTSPPPQGPLHTIDKGAFNIGKAWTEGFAKGIGPLKLPALPGMSAGGGGLVAAGAAAGSGSPTVIQLVVDGRTLAEIVSRHQAIGV